MRNKVQRDKPYAGNPHIRFSEGEIASAATPRRGTLPCKKWLRSNFLAKFCVVVAMLLCAAMVSNAGSYMEIEPNGLVQYTDWLGLPSSKWQEDDLGQLAGANTVNGTISSTDNDISCYDLFRYTPKTSGTVTLSVTGAVTCESYDCSYFGNDGCAFGYAFDTTRFILRIFTQGSSISFSGVAGFTYYIRVGAKSVCSYKISLSLPGTGGGSGGGGDGGGSGGGSSYVAITFNANRGSITSGDSRILLEPGTYTLAGYNVPVCKRSGYVFDGWYTEPTGGARMTSLVPSVATTYYAHWSAECEERTVYIRFYSGGGSGSMSTITRTVSDCKATSYTLPSCSFSKSGYAFAGWKVENACEAGSSIRQPGYTIYDLCGNLTLTATWKANSVKHIMTLYRNNSSGDGAGAKRTVTEGAYYTLPTISSLGWTRSGYTFKGWATSRGATSATYGDGARIYVSSSLYSLYALWQSNASKHVMTLYRNNSSGDGAGARRTVTEGAYYTLPTIASLGWTRNGYTFKGWATSRGATSATYGDGARIYVSFSLYSLYAVWQSNASKHVMTLYRNNSSGDGAGARRTVTDNAYYTLPTIASLGWTRNGYTFKGWATSRGATSATYGDGARIYVSFSLYSLYAVWQSNASKHVMTLYRNNSSGDGAGARRTVTDNAYYTLPTIASLGWTRSGYAFLGWATYRGGPAEYEDGISIIPGNIYSLYAVWAKLTSGGDSGWYSQSVYVNQGRYALRSGSIGDGRTSSVQLFLDSGQVSNMGGLSFFWKVSSEANYDKLECLIDGTVVATISGEHDWEKVSLKNCLSGLGPGPYTITWRYTKDSSSSSGLDAGFIDGITITGYSMEKAR